MITSFYNYVKFTFKISASTVIEQNPGILKTTSENSASVSIWSCSHSSLLGYSICFLGPKDRAVGLHVCSIDS